MFSKLDLPAAAKKGGGDDFAEIVRTRFKVNSKTTGVFVGEPQETYTHWEGEYPNSKFAGVCTGENCVMCQEGNKARFAMQINFLTLGDTGTPIMTIAEGPASFARALREKEELKGEGYFDGTVIHINRTDKTAFAVDDIKAPAGLANLKTIMAEVQTFDLKAMYEARVKKQLENADTSTTAPY